MWTAAFYYQCKNNQWYMLNHKAFISIINKMVLSQTKTPGQE